MKKSNSLVIVLIVGVTILVNILAYNYFFRADFTEDQRFTLDQSTLNILDSLKEPVTITAYFSEGLPPRINQIKKRLKNLLIEYSDRANGEIAFKIVHPGKDKKEQEAAMRAGVQPVLINVRNDDQVKQQRAFLGVTIENANNKQVIPFIKPGDPLEYELSSNIKKISDMHKPTVAFLQGQGEADLAELQQVNTALSVLHNTKDLTLTDSTNIGKDINTIAIIAPKDTFPQYVFTKLDKFLANGGNVLVAFNRSQGYLQKGMGQNLHIGLSNWLASHHIELGHQFVVDARCSQVTVRQSQGQFNFLSQIPFHFFPLIENFSKKNPISQGLEEAVFRFTNDIKYNGDSSLKYEPFAFTSKLSGYMQSPMRFNIRRQWMKSDFPLDKLVVGASLEGKMGGKKKAKMVVFGDGNFAVNGSGQSAQKLPDDNINLMTNAIDWLSDNTGLIGLRTKAITSRPLKDISSGMKTFFKYLNFLGPIIILLIYGLIRMEMNNRKRMKRMEEKYD